MLECRIQLFKVLPLQRQGQFGGLQREKVHLCIYKCLDFGTTSTCSHSCSRWMEAKIKPYCGVENNLIKGYFDVFVHVVDDSTAQAFTSTINWYIGLNSQYPIYNCKSSYWTYNHCEQLLKLKLVGFVGLNCNILLILNSAMWTLE